MKSTLLTLGASVVFRPRSDGGQRRAAVLAGARRGVLLRAGFNGIAEESPSNTAPEQLRARSRDRGALPLVGEAAVRNQPSGERVRDFRIAGQQQERAIDSLIAPRSFRSDADFLSRSAPQLFRSAAKQQRAVGSGPTARSSALVIRGHRPWPLLADRESGSGAMTVSRATGADAQRERCGPSWPAVRSGGGFELCVSRWYENSVQSVARL